MRSHALPTESPLPIRRLLAGTVLAVGVLACGGSGTGPEPGSNDAGRPVQVLFVMDTIPNDVVRIDLVVTGEGMDPVNGSLVAADGEDRITLTVVEGKERNVFARGFDTDAQILYMGERYFDVQSGSSPLVRVPLNYKGVHFPDGT